MTDEIALFIDFENIRYSLINVQRHEPDPQELISVARRFGTVMVARAYADWQRQPEFFKGSLTAAMIDRVDCPSKLRERFHQNPPLNLPPAYDRMPQRDQRLGDEYVEDEQGMVEAEGQEEPLDDAEELQAEHEEHADEQHGDMRGDMHGEMSSGTHTDEEIVDEHRGRYESAPFANSYGNGSPNNYGANSYGNGNTGGYGNGYANNYSSAYSTGGGYYTQPQSQPQQVITQSTVDLNMLMDIIETVFDRPSITTFVLMTGDRDFTRICARLKLRLNKRVIVVGVPGTVSRDLISAAEQFIALGAPGASMPGNSSYYRNQQPYQQIQGPVELDEPGFIQFLDYIDRHWSWRTVGGVANFIGDAFNPKNRFRGRLTRDSARDLLRICIDEGVLILSTDPTGSENLRLNRDHPVVVTGLTETTIH